MVTDLVKKGLFGIVFLLIAVTIIGATASIVDDESEDITQNSRCTDAGCFWDSSTYSLGVAGCVNASSVSNVSCSVAHTGIAYPLEGLFDTGGVVILTFMGAGVLLVVLLGLKLWKNKR